MAIITIRNTAEWEREENIRAFEAKGYKLINRYVNNEGFYAADMEYPGEEAPFVPPPERLEQLRAQQQAERDREIFGEPLKEEQIVREVAPGVKIIKGIPLSKQVKTMSNEQLSKAANLGGVLGYQAQKEIDARKKIPTKIEALKQYGVTPVYSGGKLTGFEVKTREGGFSYFAPTPESQQAFIENVEEQIKRPIYVPEKKPEPKISFLGAEAEAKRVSEMPGIPYGTVEQKKPFTQILGLPVSDINVGVGREILTLGKEEFNTSSLLGRIEKAMASASESPPLWKLPPTEKVVGKEIRRPTGAIEFFPANIMEAPGQIFSGMAIGYASTALLPVYTTMWIGKEKAAGVTGVKLLQKTTAKSFEVSAKGLVAPVEESIGGRPFYALGMVLPTIVTPSRFKAGFKLAKAEYTRIAGKAMAAQKLVVSEFGGIKQFTYTAVKSPVETLARISEAKYRMQFKGLVEPDIMYEKLKFGVYAEQELLYKGKGKYMGEVKAEAVTLPEPHIEKQMMLKSTAGLLYEKRMQRFAEYEAKIKAIQSPEELVGYLKTKQFLEVKEVKGLLSEEGKHVLGKIIYPTTYQPTTRIFIEKKTPSEFILGMKKRIRYSKDVLRVLPTSPPEKILKFLVRPKLRKEYLEHVFINMPTKSQILAHELFHGLFPGVKEKKILKMEARLMTAKFPEVLLSEWEKRGFKFSVPRTKLSRTELMQPVPKIPGIPDFLKKPSKPLASLDARIILKPGKEGAYTALLLGKIYQVQPLGKRELAYKFFRRIELTPEQGTRLIKTGTLGIDLPEIPGMKQLTLKMKKAYQYEPVLGKAKMLVEKAFPERVRAAGVIGKRTIPREPSLENIYYALKSEETARVFKPKKIKSATASVVVAQPVAKGVSLKGLQTDVFAPVYRDIVKRGTIPKPKTPSELKMAVAAKVTQPSVIETLVQPVFLGLKTAVSPSLKAKTMAKKAPSALQVQAPVARVSLPSVFQIRKTFRAEPYVESLEEQVLTTTKLTKVPQTHLAALAPVLSMRSQKLSLAQVSRTRERQKPRQIGIESFAAMQRSMQISETMQLQKQAQATMQKTMTKLKVATPRVPPFTSIFQLPLKTPTIETPPKRPKKRYPLPPIQISFGPKIKKRRYGTFITLREFAPPKSALKLKIPKVI